MSEVNHVGRQELEAGLEHIRQSPKDGGRVEMIVRRPRAEERENVAEALLDEANGLVGDNWKTRGSRSMPDGSSNPDMQITLMNSRAVNVIARTRERWGLAGDQLFVDLDLSEENLPPGTRLIIGEAEIEVSAHPHTGCKKFLTRFGQEAVEFVNSPEGRRMHLRGINARIIRGGVVKVGDEVKRA